MCVDVFLKENVLVSDILVRREGVGQGRVQNPSTAPEMELPEVRVLSLLLVPRGILSYQGVFVRLLLERDGPRSQP